MNYRDWLQQVIYKIINPVVRGMIKIGITPNFITTTGLILNIVLFLGFHYHFSCFDRFADGKLRTRTCRRAGTGM